MISSNNTLNIYILHVAAVLANLYMNIVSGEMNILNIQYTTKKVTSKLSINV